jgi:hypothetical protein
MKWRPRRRRGRAARAPAQHLGELLVAQPLDLALRERRRRTISASSASASGRRSLRVGEPTCSASHVVHVSSCAPSRSSSHASSSPLRRSVPPSSAWAVSHARPSSPARSAAAPASRTARTVTSGSVAVLRVQQRQAVVQAPLGAATAGNSNARIGPGCGGWSVDAHGRPPVGGT